MKALKRKSIHFSISNNTCFALILLTLIPNLAFSQRQEWIGECLESKQNEYFLSTDKKLSVRNLGGSLWIPKNPLANPEKDSAAGKENSFRTAGFFFANENTILKLSIKWTVIGDSELNKKNWSAVKIKIDDVDKILIVENAEEKLKNSSFQFSLENNELKVKDLWNETFEVFKLHKTVEVIGSTEATLWDEYIMSVYY